MSRPHAGDATVPSRAGACLVRRSVTTVVFVIAGLSFAFGFGNGYTLGRELGVPGWIAPLVAPAVDLSVVALLVTLQYLRASNVAGRLIGPRLLLVFCGLVTLALNMVHPLLTRQVGQACFYAISPLLLIGWSEVGPKLLALLHSASRVSEDDDGTVPDGAGPSSELVVAARRLDAQHRRAHQRPITRDKLRAGLKVSNAVAGELVRIVRGTEESGGPS